MNLPHNSPLPPDLDAVAAELRRQRATLDEDENGRIWRQIEPSVGAPVRSRFSGSRMTLVALLAGGVLVSGGSGALAISGSSDPPVNAAQSSYAPPQTTPNGPLQPTIQGTTQSGPPTNTTNPTNTTPTTDTGTNTVAPTVATSPLQPVAQASEAPVKSLPFTGLVAIPVIAVGLGLLGFGVMMRRRTRSET